jgi:putative ABC transport system substrate-binding protein
MQRRSFITLLGGAAAAWPLAVRAQQRERMRRTGVLSQFAENDADWPRRAAAFRQGFAELGWLEGRSSRCAPTRAWARFATPLVGAKEP